MDKKILDIGCGLSKVENSWGIDILQYPEVDQILDLNNVPWDLPADHFEIIYAQHVIEHVVSIPEFMNEVHRIAKDGATVHVVTPHFSSIDSYSDPTHSWDLPSEWNTTMTDYYLQVQVSRVTHLKEKISFGKSALSFIPQIIIILKGINWWKNRHLC